MLDAISPDIISSKDPEGTMLKCASKNNLSPAQLEHLGQVYNTTKSITGFNVMDNRGDSFSIVDVPAMISKYASYDPNKKLTGKSKSVHKALNESMLGDDDSSIEVTFKVASRKRLPNLTLMALRDVHVEEDVIEKSAAEKVAEVASVYADIAQAEETISQALFDAREDIFDKCASITAKLTPDDGRWAEAKADFTKLMGEKAASTISIVETYFKNRGHHVEEKTVKLASYGNIVRDRHGVLQDLSNIAELSEFLEKYAAAPGSNPNPDKNPPPGPNSNPYANTNLPTNTTEKSDRKGSGEKLMKLEEVLDPWGSLKDNMFSAPGTVANAVDTTFSRGERMMKLLGPNTNETQKKVDKGLFDATKETTLAQLMLSDKVISSYDQDEVQDMYDSLASLSPALTKNPTLMAAALKEALQYGSIPIPIAKGIADLQKTITENERNQRMIDNDKYRY